MTILPAGRVGPVVGRPIAARRSSAGFAVPDEAQTSPTTAATSIDLTAFLSLQEIEQPSERNRRARQHGQSLLEALTWLQHARLVGGDDLASLATLAELARTTPTACDPGLRSVIDAISLRAHVELARHAVTTAHAAAHKAPWRHVE